MKLARLMFWTVIGGVAASCIAGATAICVLWEIDKWLQS